MRIDPRTGRQATAGPSARHSSRGRHRCGAAGHLRRVGVRHGAPERRGHGAADAARCLPGTEAVVYLNSGTPPQWFLYAEDGRVVGDFEPGVEAGQLGGEDPGRLVPALQEAGLLLPDGTSAPDANAESGILEMGERHFGLTLPREAVEHGTLAAVSLSPF
ncbi:DUF6461 domain-containing protein [Streptomyces sp. NPDC026673]|uniref:DUF6461 domain-containing protein n=1 Tax=Streptomyces sp. NPDC026673 TaxID=3155724 RepID=UPI0033F3E047